MGFIGFVYYELGCVKRKIDWGTAKFVFGFIVFSAVFMVGFSYLIGPSFEEIRDESIIEVNEIKDADCKQLLDIYLNEEDEYLRSSEKMAKKYFDVKCISNQSLEVIP